MEASITPPLSVLKSRNNGLCSQPDVRPYVNSLAKGCFS